MIERNRYTENLTRSILKNRIESFLPRITRLKKTKAAPHAFSLQELAADLERTLVDIKDRIQKGNV